VKKIRAIFIVLSIAVILSIGISAMGLQLENFNLNDTTAIGNNHGSNENKLQNVSAETNVKEDVLGKIELHFLDVGQGDSTLVILPNNKTMLIDAGKREYGTSVVNYIKKLNISKIDYLVMTHPDADHIGGMSTVINNFDIGTIYMSDVTSTTKTFEDLLLNIDSKGLTISTLKANDIILESDDFNVTLLSPIKKYSDNNDMSLVIHITYMNNSFLLMGDAGTKVENDILNSNSNIIADLIKIGHHGSSYSSNTKFIEKVSPQFAIISCGKDNQYGHPSSQILEILEKNGVKVYRTDEVRNIIAISDGNSIDIEYNT